METASSNGQTPIFHTLSGALHRIIQSAFLQFVSLESIYFLFKNFKGFIYLFDMSVLSAWTPVDVVSPIWLL